MTTNVLGPEELRSAITYGEFLRVAIHERKLPPMPKTRAAGTCFSIAMDHHHAVVVLLEERLHASAASLLRPAFESYVRGEWLSLCASDDAVERFWEGRGTAKLVTMVKQLDKTETHSDGEISDTYRNLEGFLNDYSHTGINQVRYWNSPASIENNFNVATLREFLRFAERFASLSAMSILRIVNDLPAMQRLLVALSEREKVHTGSRSVD